MNEEHDPITSLEREKEQRGLLTVFSCFVHAMHQMIHGPSHDKHLWFWKLVLQPEPLMMKIIAKINQLVETLQIIISISCYTTNDDPTSTSFLVPFRLNIFSNWDAPRVRTKHINRANGKMNGNLSTDKRIGEIRHEGRRKGMKCSFTRGNEWENHRLLSCFLFLFSFPFAPPFRRTSIKKNKYENYFNLFRFSLSSHHLLSFSDTSCTCMCSVALLDPIHCSSKKLPSFNITCHCNGW